MHSCIFSLGSDNDEKIARAQAEYASVRNTQGY